jgi:hypothetical protein
MNAEKLIIGAGGGGGGKGGGGKARTPKEATDSLNSTQYAQLIDLISEGEIEGLKNGLQSIFIDNTPLQNADGSFNFKDVIVRTRRGTQAQNYFGVAAETQDEKPVNTTVQQATPIVRTITDTSVNAVRLTITVPQLQRFTDKGDIVGASFQLQIAIQYNNGGYTNVIDDTISGRSADTYQRDYLIDLTGAFPVDIRVTRVTPDSPSVKLSDAFNWSSYTEIIYAKLRYPNSALVAIRIDAEQFNSIPQRAYLVRGIKVQIPNNATVDSITGRLIYSGIWNGSFGAAQWTTDPAWILWDLLTSKRYGFGDHIQAAQLDKWAFYSASQYSSEVVPDGFGGSEPRFSCNVNIQTAEEAYKLINDMCSVFRVMPYWSTGALTISQDKPTDPAYLFTLANVTEEGFSYSGGSLKSRPTVAVVSYLDLTQRDIAFEVVEDQAAIAKYGVVRSEISAFACTSRGQASRIGEWLLYSEQYESEVVSFTASIDAGVVVRPGQVIQVSDPVRAGSRRGGRISAATTTVVTVDDTTELPSSGGFLSVILPTGLVERRTVVSRSGSAITVTPAFSVAPNVNSIWVYITSDLQTSTWRVLSVQEQEGAQYVINALAYNSSKYNYIERGAALQQRDVSNLNVSPAAPTGLQATEALYESNGRALAKIIVSWKSVPGVNQYRIRWRQRNGNWARETISRLDYEILDTAATQYEINVFALNAARLPSVESANLMFNAVGKTAPPVAVTGLYANLIDPQTVELAWDLHPDLDVRVGGKILIRHTPRTVGAAWADATTIVPAVTGNQTRKNVPFVVGTYLLRAQDDLGNLSTNATSIVLNAQVRPQPVFTVRVGSSPVSQPTLTFGEDLTTPPFQGNMTDMFYNAELDGLILANGVPWDSLPGLVDSFTSIDATGGIVASGEYEFGSTLDLGAVYEVNLRGRFLARAFDPGSFWDDYGLIDSLATIDDVIGNPDAQLKFRYSTNGIAYSDWIPYQSNLVRGRTFQFKVVATSGDQMENILIEELGMTALLQQQTQTDGPITSGVGTYTATFTDAFYAAPQVSITALDMASGDFATIANVTRTGFQVTFRNSGGTVVSRQFHYLATGYGKEIA